MDPLLTYSQRAIAHGSKSFAMAARLFEPRTRERALLLYAWCRHCDDEIDGQELGAGQRPPEPARQQRRLQTLVRQTRAALAGEPQSEPAFHCFQRVVADCGIPRRYPLELLEGFAMDVRGERYRTLADTVRYCYHVAGTVGAMMAGAMGVSDPAIVRRGIHLGIALQLTNIARDVADDARVGRLYLPAEWLEAAGVAPEPAAVLDGGERLATVVLRLLDAAEPYYESAGAGIAHLPLRSAWAVNAAARIYREIGEQVRAQGARAGSVRVAVGSLRKLALLLGAGAGLLKLRRRGAQRVGSELWEPADFAADVPADLAVEPAVAYPAKR